ncbi:hypothetical protein WJX72_001260 [[Myrmecia] bisecta]|uniref:Uncharacterized protein n=1 Tax=[Myrmecia] bisecta TaxID=41462 RepID=A0AAW1PZD0_9CHLO
MVQQEDSCEPPDEPISVRQALRKVLAQWQGANKSPSKPPAQNTAVTVAVAPVAAGVCAEKGSLTAVPLSEEEHSSFDEHRTMTLNLMFIQHGCHY